MDNSHTHTSDSDSPVTWIDTHCHFDFDDFDKDREEIWRQCHSNGITTMVIPGVEPKQWQRMADLSESMPGLYYSIGLHPCWLDSYLPQKSWQTELPHLRQLLLDATENSACIAIGECGLDQYIDGHAAQQEAVLTCHLEAARECDLPVILHCRRAHNDLLRLLKNHPVPRGGVVHAFSGSREMAEQYWAMGFYLGVGGTITYERANKTRNAIRALPLEALILETDAPDMPLCGHQGKRNSPGNIPSIGATLAELRGESLTEIARQTTDNARRLFNLKNVFL